MAFLFINFLFVVYKSLQIGFRINIRKHIKFCVHGYFIFFICLYIEKMLFLAQYVSVQDLSYKLESDAHVRIQAHVRVKKSTHIHIVCTRVYVVLLCRYVDI